MGKLMDDLRKKHAAAFPKARRHALNFLAHKDEIEEAMREGFTAKQVWEQMVENGMTTMSYANLCRLVKRHITLAMANVDGAASSVGGHKSSAAAIDKSHEDKATRKGTPLAKMTEKERLDLLKEEAFASVRSRKSAGPLIAKPKSREEENRELFGK
jgi:hypothetical protein